MNSEIMPPPFSPRPPPCSPSSSFLVEKHKGSRDTVIHPYLSMAASHQNVPADSSASAEVKAKLAQ